MKICLINNLYKPYAKGGAEKVTESIARGLTAAGHEVFIIATKPRGGAFQAPARQLAEKPRIHYLNSLYFNLNKFPKFLRLFWHLWDMFNFVNYFKIKRILKSEKCDVVITNNLMGVGYLTDLAIKRLKLKQIHIVHDIQLIHPSGLLRFGEEKLIENYFSRNYAGLASLLFGSPQVVIFPSRWLRDRYLDKIFFVKSKRIVLPNPAPPINNEIKKKDDKVFKFLFLGQVEKHKGLNLLIQAFKKAEEKYPNIELIIAGRGSEVKSAKALAGSVQNIKFLGWQEEARVNELLRDCHSLVMPTLCYENCPTVILEAFSAGLPVIAADLGGISELLSLPAEASAKAGENAGVLFRPGNVADLVDKMEWAIENKDNLADIIKAAGDKAASGSVENYIKELEGLIK